MRYASARGFEIKAPFNNNLPPQTGDLIVNPINPVNPDSKLINTGNIPLKYPSPPKPNTIYLVFVENYARSSHWFLNQDFQDLWD